MSANSTTSNQPLWTRPSVNEFSPYDSNFTKSSEIPIFCIQIAEKLAKEPLFLGYGSIIKKSKVIALARWNDARICDLFSKNAEILFGEKGSWPIYDFGCGSNLRYDLEKKLIEHGLCFWIDDKREMCSSKELNNSYDQILERMKTGWKASEIRDYPNMPHTEDPFEFALFVKKASLVQEDVLIRFIAGRFDLCNDITCCTERTRCAREEPGGNVYLWIKKSALEEFIDKFGFKFSTQS